LPIRAIAIDASKNTGASGEFGLISAITTAVRTSAEEIMDVHTNERRKRMNLVIVTVLLRFGNAVNNAKKRAGDRFWVVCDVFVASEQVL
jgi:hypothetical protein